MPDSVVQTMEELRTVLGQRRDNKGKTPKGITTAIKDHWSHLVATVFAERNCPVESLFQELSHLPPVVVAVGIASAWENMDEARRASYLRWLGSLDSEKAASQKVVLISSLLERSPAVSLELLCSLSLNQELRNSLAVAILGRTPEKVGLMIAADTPEWKARQALERLCEISEGPKVEMRGKWEVMRLTLKTIVERKMQKDTMALRLIQHVEGQLPHLAPHFRDQIQDLLRNLDSALLGRFFPSVAVQARAATTKETSQHQTEAKAPIIEADSPPPVLPARSTSPSAVSEVIPESDSVASNVLERLAGWIGTLQGQSSLLTDARARILQLEQENQTVKAQLAAARVAAQQESQHRVQVLEEEAREKQKAVDSALASVRALESDLQAVRERESQSAGALRQRETEFAQEREELQRLIEANADRRLQEFRNAVGGSLRQLLNRVPNRGASVPSDLGAVLLTRLHEVIDELESKGIRARPEREAVPR